MQVMLSVVVLSVCTDLWFRCVLGASVFEQDSGPPVAAFRDVQIGKYGFINRQGAVVLRPKYDDADDFVNGLAMVKREGKPGFIDTSGKLRFTLPPGTEKAQYLSEGLVWFLGEKKQKWGLCNEQGEIVLAPTYDRVEPSSEDLAAVNLGAEWKFRVAQTGGKWGYVNRRGKLVIPVQYAYADRFSDGLAKVLDSAGTKLIDKSGKVVLDLGLVNTGDFREGLIPVYIDRSLQGKDWQTRVIDREGKPAFTVDGYVNEFHEGMAVISVRNDPKSDSLSGYVDRKGSVVITPKFAEAKVFSEGLAAVRTKKTTAYYGMGDAWGYIDKTGKYRIEPLYNEAHSFYGGVGSVHLGGTIRQLGHQPPFWEGGEWWLIDKAGKKLVRR